MTRRGGRQSLQAHLKNKDSGQRETWQVRDVVQLRLGIGRLSRHEIEQIWPRLLKSRGAPHVLEAMQLVLERMDWHRWPANLAMLEPARHADRVPALLAAVERADGAAPRLALMEALVRLEHPSVEPWLVRQLGEGSAELKLAALAALATCGTRRALWAVIEAQDVRALASAARAARAAIEAREPASALLAPTGALTEGARRGGELTEASDDPAALSAKVARQRVFGEIMWSELGSAPRALPWQVYARAVVRAHGAPWALLACWVVVSLVVVVTGMSWVLGLAAMLAALLVPCWLGMGRIGLALRLLRKGEQAVALRSEGSSPLNPGHGGEFMTLGGRYRYIPELFEEGSRARRARMLYLEGEAVELRWSEVRSVMGWE
jgi:hypothetical protein